MWPTHELYAAGIAAYALASAGGLASHLLRKSESGTRVLLCLLALTGALLQIAASTGALLAGAESNWFLSSGVPYLNYSVRLDPLSSYFNLSLSILAAAVSIYSFGYLKHPPAGKNVGLFCFFYNLLLLCLTFVFTAANVLFFLIAWELMVVAAYFLVVTEHEKDESRRSGLLYIFMSRGGTGMLFVGFLLLISAAGSMEFTDFHGIGNRLPSHLGAAAFLFFFFGFGVKAGIIPLHIWLPAAHPVAPSNISALMSGIVIKSGI